MSTRRLLAARKAALVARSDRERDALVAAIGTLRAGLSPQRLMRSLPIGRLLVRLATLAAESGGLGRTAGWAAAALTLLRGIRGWRTRRRLGKRARTAAPAVEPGPLAD